MDAAGAGDGEEEAGPAGEVTVGGGGVTGRLLVVEGDEADAGGDGAGGDGGDGDSDDAEHVGAAGAGEGKGDEGVPIVLGLFGRRGLLWWEWVIVGFRH